MSQLSSVTNNKQQQKKVCAGCGKEEGTGLVLKSCSACHSVSYCGSACQRAGWPGHKVVCKEIQLSIKSGGSSGVGSLPVAAPNSSVTRYQEAHVWNACFYGHLEELQKMLHQRGLDFNCAEPATGGTAAHAAAQEGHDKCLSAIIQYGGVDLAKRTKTGMAPIHTACKFGRVACLLVLLDHGVDSSLPMANDDGFTPAVICSISGHVKCLALLLDRGADLSLATSEGVTPAHAACLTGKLKCLQLLLARGANLNAKDSNGQTPLDFARQYEHSDCVELLIQKSAKCSEKDFAPMREYLKVRQRCYFCLVYISCQGSS
jgi:hypothetical protein